MSMMPQVVIHPQAQPVGDYSGGMMQQQQPINSNTVLCNPDTTLWMGNLKPDWDAEFIKEAFEQLGQEVLNVKMVQDRFGTQSASYCFVEFSDGESARDTMLALSGRSIPNDPDKTKFNLSFANSPNQCIEYNLFASNLSASVDDSIFVSDKLYTPIESLWHVLWLADFPADASTMRKPSLKNKTYLCKMCRLCKIKNKQIGKKLFGERYPSCRGAKVYRNADGSSRKFGFIRFTNETDQQKALIELNKHRLKGKEMVLKLAIPKDRRNRPFQPRGSFGGGHQSAHVPMVNLAVGDVAQQSYGYGSNHGVAGFGNPVQQVYNPLTPMQTQPPYLGNQYSGVSHNQGYHSSRGNDSYRRSHRSHHSSIPYSSVPEVAPVVGHGKELRGERIVVESAHGRSSRRSYESRPGGFGDRYRRDDYDQRNRSRYNAPRSNRHRLIVENLSTRYTWFDLKDMMNQYAEVTFADAHKTEQRVGLVCFASHSGLKRALEKCQGKEVNGRRIKLIDDSMESPSRSRSRDRRRSPDSRRGKSHSPGVDKGRRRSRSVSKSRSRASSSRSLSRSPVQRAKRVKSPGSNSNYTSHGKSSSPSPPPKKKGKTSSERDHSPVGKRSPYSNGGTS